MEKISQNVYHSYTITPHHIPKHTHQFNHGESLRSCTTLLTLSINLSDYSWLNISNETVTLRPSGTKKCKQTAIT